MIPIRRFIVTMIGALVLLSPVSASASRPACREMYTIKQTQHQIADTYAKRRHVTRAESETLNHMEVCQHSRRASAHVHDMRSRAAYEWRLRQRETSYSISGLTSTFGWPTEGVCWRDRSRACDRTADGGHTDRPCIALRDVGRRGHEFLLFVYAPEGVHRAIVLLCDWGPAAWTGRAIDITGKTLYRIGISPWGYGNYFGRVVLLR